MIDSHDLAVEAEMAEPVTIDELEHRDFSRAEPPIEGKPKARKRGLIIISLLLVVAALAYVAYRMLAPAAEETDDAYVGGDIVSISSREGGTVLAIHADNTQMVSRGEPLIDLDPATEDVALDNTEAQLGQAVRAFRASKATVDEVSAEIVSARTELNKAVDDLGRRQTAAAQGAVSGEELAHASDAVSTMRAALNLAIAKQAQAASIVQGTSVYDNPAVLAAEAAVRRAAISRAYMSLSAPVGGVVSNRTVQLGQRVAPGTPLMAVVPLNSLWVDANFRETQLQDMRVGQPVTVEADMYGGKKVFHGRVLGLGAGSGNAFALLPPQNATGNWIKIVQRLSVRIGLDPKELAATPLRIGLSVKARVETADHSGSSVGGSRAPAGGAQAVVNGGSQIEAKIRQIIDANMGGEA